MEYENTLHLEALKDALRLIRKGFHHPLEILKAKYSIGDNEMSEKQWNLFYKSLPTYIFENADDEETVKNFLTEFSVLDNTVLETVAKNEYVAIEYISLLLEKQKEELLLIACSQDTAELLNFLLNKDQSLANLRLFDGRFILHYAMQFGSEDIINSLLYYGAILEVVDNNNRNVLHYAAMNKSEAFWLSFSNNPKFEKFLKQSDCYGEFPHKA